jgi:hypothetical protein
MLEIGHKFLILLYLSKFRHNFGKSFFLCDANFQVSLLQLKIHMSVIGVVFELCRSLFLPGKYML